MFNSVDKSENISPGHSISDNSERLLWGGKEGARIYRSFQNKRPGSWNIKRSLLIKENQMSQVQNLMLFYVWETARVRASWNHSFDMHLGYLEPVPCSFPSWVPSRSPLGAAVMWWLDGCNILCLLTCQATLPFKQISEIVKIAANRLTLRRRRVTRTQPHLVVFTSSHVAFTLLSTTGAGWVPHWSDPSQTSGQGQLR